MDQGAGGGTYGIRGNGALDDSAPNRTVTASSCFGPHGTAYRNPPGRPVVDQVVRATAGRFQRLQLSFP